MCRNYYYYYYYYYVHSHRRTFSLTGSIVLNKGYTTPDSSE